MALRFDLVLPFSRADAWRHMAIVVGHWPLRGYGRFAVELKSTGELIGRVGLWYPEGWPDVECGWAIHPDHWGRGYATEAAAETIRLGFATLGAPRLISLVRPDNARSARVAERLGGRLDGTWHGRGVETLVYAYTPSHFDAPPQSRGEVGGYAVGPVGARARPDEGDAKRAARDAR